MLKKRPTASKNQTQNFLKKYFIVLLKKEQSLREYLNETIFFLRRGRPTNHRDKTPTKNNLIISSLLNSKN